MSTLLFIILFYVIDNYFRFTNQQIQYADILKKVEPLRNELKTLEAAAMQNKEEAMSVEVTIGALEKSIAKYKEEYAVLISQAQAIKSDLATVEAKVARSVALIKSLSNERGRWDSGSETFKSQMSTIFGDCLLSAAFMAYGGYFDQHLRGRLFSSWCQHLESVDIHFRKDLALVEVNRISFFSVCEWVVNKVVYYKKLNFNW